MLSDCSCHITRPGIKTTNCYKWVDWWQILWPPCEKMRVIECRSLEIPPLSWNNTVLAFINVVDYQMPGFEINPCRWTSVLWDSTNYLQRHLSLLTFPTSPHCQIPGVKLKCYVEKNPTILHFPLSCKVKFILFVSNNLITLLLLFKLRIWIVEKYCVRHLPAQILLIVGFQPPGQNATPFVFEVTWFDHKMKFSSSADWYCFKHEKIFETERTYCVCMKLYVVCTIYTIYSATE